MTMTSDQITQLYDDARALRAAGKEADAKALLMQHLRELPEETQTQIMLEMFTDAMEGEAAALQTKRDLQQMGLEAVEKILEDAEGKTAAA